MTNWTPTPTGRHGHGRLIHDPRFDHLATMRAAGCEHVPVCDVECPGVLAAGERKDTDAVDAGSVTR
jgi:hypothetical protein